MLLWCSPIMVGRLAVLLIPSKSTHPQVLLFCKISLSIIHLESTLLQVFILKTFIPFRMNTYKKPPGGWGLMVNQLFLRSNLCGSSPNSERGSSLGLPRHGQGH